MGKPTVLIVNPDGTPAPEQARVNGRRIAYADGRFVLYAPGDDNRPVGSYRELRNARQMAAPRPQPNRARRARHDLDAELRAARAVAALMYEIRAWAGQTAPDEVEAGVARVRAALRP